MLTTERPRTPRPRKLALKRAVAGEQAFSAQVELILSAIETGQFSPRERRCVGRAPYRAHARLRLFSDLPDTPAWTLYTRDANARGVGFITPHRLPLGYGGLIDLAGPDGTSRSIPCTLLRCREAAPGWYEGSLYFNRHQPDFER
ncbi:MAG TPA: hypothetical protein VFC78_24470 [Tepidisphaeraceae bacterium]|nr:hypothetical protein [Tepidisphaeraceae bacterium]